VEVRDRAQRIRDVQRLLVSEIDAWVATSGENGEPYLIPLSFVWTGDKIIMATPENSATVRNLRSSGRARVAIGPTRDVVMIDARCELTRPSPEDPLWAVHANQAGFDARDLVPEYLLLVLTPEEIQTWRNPAELPGRTVFRDGAWLDPNCPPGD
jgi:general stress protein 26